MSGCPNGCTRPSLGGEYPKRVAHGKLAEGMSRTEVVVVAKAPGSYLMLLGGAGATVNDRYFEVS